MDDQRSAGAQALFEDFAKAMNAWEVEAYALSRPENGGLEAHLAPIRAGLVAIYDRFLTVRERKIGRLAGPDVGYPPEYDPANERVVAVQDLGKKLVLETVWTHPVMRDYSRQQRYTLVFANAAWRIDKKEVLRATTGKWTAQTF